MKNEKTFSSICVCVCFLTMFNTKDGFLEATVRGCVGGFLKSEDYSNLQQCETLDDIKLYLVSFFLTFIKKKQRFQQTDTDYGKLIQSETASTHPSAIIRCCMQKIVHDFTFFESQVC